MDDISRELPPDTTGATPVSERQKGPEELARFERGIVDEELVVDRARMFVATDRVLPVISTDPGPADEPAARPPDAELGDPGSDDAQREDSAHEDAEPAAEPITEPLAEDDAIDGIDAEAAAAAVAAEAEIAEVEEVLAEDEDDGLPAVPQLDDPAAVARMIFVLMLTSRDGMTLFRLAQACNTSQKLVESALELLQQQLQQLGLPVELTRVADTVRWMSSPETFPYLQRLRGVKKLEKLSPAALETLAVVAYRQPVMRGEIEAIRGVKAGPMLRTLLQHKLVRVTGRADVPGKPLQYGTTQQFLERFGLASLDDLPSIKEWKNLG